MANLGPSEKLLKAFQSGVIGWGEFNRRYRKELLESDTMDRRSPTIRNHGQKFILRLLQEMGRRSPVTLMCHCAEDEAHCHRHVLRQVLEGKV